MSKIEANAHSHKPKTSKLAIVSAVIALVCFVVYFFVIHNISRAHLWLWDISGIPGLIAFILGIVALVRIIRKKRARLRGWGFAICGIVLGGLASYFWFPELFIQSGSHGRAPVFGNLKRLGLALMMYADDNDGRYPPVDKWCDVLMEEGHVSEKDFICPKMVLYWPFLGRKYKTKPMFIWPVPKKGRCHFALNPNCKPDSPRDVVLLFETRKGWNQYGGPELLTIEHHNGKGCCVVYNDLHSAWIGAQSLDELGGAFKWKDSESTILKFK